MPELTAYLAAYNEAAFTDLSDHGWLRLTGGDRLDLLHRLSTNAVKALAPRQGAATVLTSPEGRVQALLFVYAGQDAAFVRLMPGQMPATLRYLQRMIFWQDDVQLTDLSSATAQFGVHGPQAAAIVTELTGIQAAALMPYGWETGAIGGAEVGVHRGGALEQWAYSLTAAAVNTPVIRAALADHCPQLSPASIDLLRIEAGLPAWGRELSDAVTPLETGLLAAVSFNKGCYTGQEVIARQTNYDKVTRRLVGLVFDREVTRDATLAGAQVAGPGRGGFVGSAAHSPRLNRTIALAVVPRELTQPGTTVTVIHGEVRDEAVVHALPFIHRE